MKMIIIHCFESPELQPSKMLVEFSLLGSKNKKNLKESISFRRHGSSLVSSRVQDRKIGHLTHLVIAISIEGQFSQTTNKKRAMNFSNVASFLSLFLSTYCSGEKYFFKAEGSLAEENYECF